MYKVVTFGELMLRLTPPNYEKIRMTSSFEPQQHIKMGTMLLLHPRCM